MLWVYGLKYYIVYVAVKHIYYFIPILIGIK